MSGIYKIVNRKNKKAYIGKTKNLKSRKSEHFSDLENGKHHNKYLQEDYNKYGPEAFFFRPVKKCSEEELRVFEIVVIRKLEQKYSLYNIAGMRKN